MLTLEEAKHQLADRVLVRSVDQVRRGHIRVETGLQYPDGSSIDVFLTHPMPLAPGAQMRLSDLGQTTGWLLDMQIRPWMSKKRTAFIEDVLESLSVKQVGGELVLDLKPSESLLGGVLKLGQACIRVADLMFTRRASLQNAFNEDLEEVLADGELQYQPNAELIGRQQRSVRVDYLVQGRARPSAVLSLSATNAQSAHNLSNEIFRRWYDLDTPDGLHVQHVTVFDDRQRSVFRDEDLHRLGELSIVAPFSEKTALIELLQAA